MRIKAMHAAALGLSIGLGALCAASCGAVIGVDKYRDAVAELCHCKDLSEMKDCERKIMQRLEGGPKAATQWINDFGPECLCDKAIECIARQPLCTECGQIRLKDLDHVADATGDEFVAVCKGNELVDPIIECYCGPCKDVCKGYAICRSGDKVGIGMDPCKACMTANRTMCDPENTDPLVACVAPDI